MLNICICYTCTIIVLFSIEYILNNHIWVWIVNIWWTWNHFSIELPYLHAFRNSKSIVTPSTCTLKRRWTCLVKDHSCTHIAYFELSNKFQFHSTMSKKNFRLLVVFAASVFEWTDSVWLHVNRIGWKYPDLFLIEASRLFYQCILIKWFSNRPHFRNCINSLQIIQFLIEFFPSEPICNSLA